MADGPMVDRTGVIVAFLGLLPEPVKNFYRACVPDRLRQTVRDLQPYEQDKARKYLGEGHSHLPPDEQHAALAQLRDFYATQAKRPHAKLAAQRRSDVIGPDK